MKALSTVYRSVTRGSTLGRADLLGAGRVDLREVF